MPADRPERYAKALACGADAVIVDLEDAVARRQKVQARAALNAWLAEAPAAVIVRINGVDSAWFGDDLAICHHASVLGVMLPKAERADDLARVASAAPGKRLLPLVETAVGLDRARELAAAPGVERLAFGSIDFQLDVSIDGDADELLYFRSHLVLASRLGGCLPPVDGVSTAIDDLRLLESDTEHARRLGFGAKLCIHPRQVAIVNRGVHAERRSARMGASRGRGGRALGGRSGCRRRQDGRPSGAAACAANPCAGRRARGRPIAMTADLALPPS